MKLGTDEREVLLAEVAQALDHVRHPELKLVYGELLSAVDRGDIPDDVLEPLQDLLELGLESGRIRRAHTAHGEMAAQRVYGRTPKARAVRATTDAVNEALAGLQGRTLEEISVSPAGPGSYTLTLGTDQGRLLLRIDRHGVEVRSVEVG